MPRPEATYPSKARSRATVLEELVHDILQPDQVIHPDGTITTLGGEKSPLEDIGSVVASVVIEGDDLFRSVPVDTVQAIALAAFHLGVEVADAGSQG